MTIEMSSARFDDAVSDALDLLPKRLADAMNNVVVLVQDSHPDDDSLLGLYEGIALTERTTDYSGVLPDRITIYRQPILQMCQTEAEVIDEIAVTVVHEIAHHFGISDEQLHQLGWG